ncbi:uncharacterized protein LOC113227310 [Hyposmocoma kahamanoa]|uniref:uncharacterized protein LOC113227310 n=1 Tax=Hyposmocoma kahamanoa TaxID=1477025 RepID=UPI000E6D8B8A|nr:uncharacterized protein LOC113227310 [Hyposmocoma kahamanoa]
MSHVNCSVYGCYSSPKTNGALRFHRFPRDARNQLWIDACRRPDLKNKSVDQLYSMYVCSLHFEKWMYMKRKLKSTAIPTLNIPSASMYSVSTQTEVPVLEITIDLHSVGVQREIDAKTMGASAVGSSPARTSQITQEMTDSFLRKRLREQAERSAKKLKLTENSMRVTRKQFLQGCDKFLSPSLSTIAKVQANLKHPSKNNRYTKEFKLFCLNIYCSSPYAYKFLSKTLCLPPKRTLTTLPIPVGTKISHYIWGVLSQVIKRLSPFDRECIFCMDVMSLKRSLFYNTHKDKINGLHEIDGIQSPYAAGYALTIMLKGIFGDWRQLVGYALTTTNEIDESFDKWIVNTIKQLLVLGFKIRAVVSDQESCLSRGVSKDNPYFEIDGKKIYYIHDVPLRQAKEYSVCS